MMKSFTCPATNGARSFMPSPDQIRDDRPCPEGCAARRPGPLGVRRRGPWPLAAWSRRARVAAWLAVPLATLAGAGARPAFAQRTGLADRADVAASVSDEVEPEGGPMHRWRGSYIALDQSVTTQTVRVGADFQSYDPTYELWLSAKPQYYFIDRAHNKLSLSVWLNAFWELTNSDTTTKQREILLGPTFVTAPYLHVFRRGLWGDRPGYKTAVSVGPRIVLPTDKASWDSGQYVSLGVTSFLSQGVPLRGEDARFWRGAEFTLGVAAGAPISRATSAVNNDIRQLREDVAGRLIVSDQLRGSMNTKYYLNLSASADVQVTSRTTFSASYVILDSWAYLPNDAQVCSLFTGCVAPMGGDNPPNFRVATWLTASLAYELTKTLNLAVGYFNRANQIGPDGQRRSPFWSPDARLFVTVTGVIPDK